MHVKSYGISHIQTPTERRFDFPVELVGLGYEIRDSQEYLWNNERHGFHKTHVLQYTLSGSGSFRWKSGQNTTTRSMQAGNLFIASHDISYEYGYNGKEAWEFLWIMLKGEYADRALTALRDPMPVMDLAHDSPPVRIIKDLLNQLSQTPRIDVYYLSSVAYDCLCQLLRLKSEAPDNESSRVRSLAKAFVRNNIDYVNGTLLAKHFGYNGKYFIDYFKKHTGLTPQKFVVDHKMQIAKSLLMNTDQKIGSIAADLGFKEDNHFSKAFKRENGMSPEQYRRSFKNPVAFDEVVDLG